MALIWYEGFDELPSGNAMSGPLLGLLSSLGVTALDLGAISGTANIVAPGRFGANCMQMISGNSSSPQIAMLMPSNMASGFVGFALNRSSWNGAQTVTLQDITGNAAQCSIQFGANGVISAYDGGGNLLGQSAALAYAASTWNYVEIGATIAPGASGGALAVRVNTVPKLTLTNVATQKTANAWFNQLIFTEAPSSYTTDLIDDMYLCDATGAAPYNSYLGNARVQFLKPGAPGASTQFTPSNTAEANWQNAGNANVDDTLYVYAATADDEDDYTVAPMASQPTIWAARVKVAARQDDATQRFIEPCLISAGTEVRDAAVALTQTYTWVAGAIHTVDPHTGSAWTYTAINAAQVGVNLST